MRPLRIALLVLMLPPMAGCGAFGPDTSTPEGRCQAAAYDDPEVKDLIVRANGGGTLNTVGLLDDQREAVARAKLRCMQQNGLAPRGGVEPVRHYR